MFVMSRNLETGSDILLSVPGFRFLMEVEMDKESSKRGGLVLAGLLGIFTWFLSGIISAGTGLKKRR